MEKGEFGVVEFRVKTDKVHNLKPIATIALTEHSSGASHYKVIPAQSNEDSNELRLYWHGVPDSHPLPFRLSTPEAVASFLEQWLESEAVYGRSCSWSDATEIEGVVISNADEEGYTLCDTCYLVLRAIPSWVYYGK